MPWQEWTTRIPALLSRWTEPHPSITGLSARRRVRLAKGLVLFLLPVAAFYPLVYLVSGETLSEGGRTALGAFIALVVALFLLRTSWARVGIWLVVFIPWAAIALAWTNELPRPDQDLLYFSIIPVVLGSLLLRMGLAIAFGAWNIAAMAGLLRGSAETGVFVPVGEVESALFFTLAVTPLILLGAGFLERSARQQEAINARLVELEAYRTRLLHVVAHDLASPLSPIQLQLELMARREGHSKGLDIMQRNVDHLEHLVRDVRDLARIEGENLPLERRPTDLATLVTDAVEGFEEPAKQRGVEHEVDVQAPLAVTADPDRVNQVLYNLITNAHKFSPAGGRIQVRAWRNDGMARVVVQDQGRGLTADEIPQLFKPFSQVHDRSEVKEKGTGLGLYISKGIIEAHGGRIWVESEGRGSGARFAFEMPLDVPTPSSPA